MKRGTRPVAEKKRDVLCNISITNFLLLSVVFIIAFQFITHFNFADNEKSRGEAESVDVTSVTYSKNTTNWPGMYEMEPKTGTAASSVTTNLQQQQPSLPSQLSSQLTSGNSSDLVIGMAASTNPYNLAVFCYSLRAVSSAAVIIWVDAPIPERHRKIAEATGVKLVAFDVAAMGNMRSYHPSTLRWPLFHRFFEESAEARQRFKRVFMVDVRDSFFQADPFAHFGTHPQDKVSPTSSAFHAFYGVEDKPIKLCGWNGGWVKDCFGEGVLGRIGHNGIVCSGVSVGTIDTVLPYLRSMSDIVSGKGGDSGGGTGATALAGRSAKFPRCERNGVDQGTHNVLVHSGAVQSLRLWHQEDTPVANMQAHRCTVDKGGVVRNRRNALVAVVHQYDRYPQLQRQLFARFVTWKNTTDFAEEWAAEPACAAFDHARGSDLFKGRCDLTVKGGAVGPQSCCAACAQAGAGCKAFVYMPTGQCFLKNCANGSAKGGSRIEGAVSGFLRR